MFETGGGLTARVLGMPVPAARFACHGCHGRDGRGGREGATDVPAIDGNALAAASPIRPAYTPENFHRAVGKGVSSSGAILDTAMPRYDLDRIRSDALMAYLRELPEIERRGVGSDAVYFGILSTRHSRAVADAYRTYLELAWAAGGMGSRIFGRSLALRTIEVEDDTDLLAELARHPVIGIVGLTPADAALSRVLIAQGIPVLFPLFPLDGDEDRDLARGLSPDWNTIFESMADRMAANDHRSVLIVTDDSSVGRTARAITAVKKKNIDVHVLSPDSLTASYASDITDAVLILLSTSRLNDKLIAALPQGVTIYGVAGQLLRRLPMLQRLGIKYEIAIENTMIVEQAVRSHSPALQVHADIVAEIIRDLLRAAGRHLRRTTLLAGFADVRREVFGGMVLDYKVNALNGTDHIRFISSPK